MTPRPNHHHSSEAAKLSYCSRYRGRLRTSQIRCATPQRRKDEGWIVHGIPKAEHALPILAHIPYELIIVDCELAGIDGKGFVRLLHNAREWRAIHLVALTNCLSAPLATELAHWGAFLARKEAWLDDLSHLLITMP